MKVRNIELLNVCLSDDDWHDDGDWVDDVVDEWDDDGDDEDDFFFTFINFFFVFFMFYLNLWMLSDDLRSYERLSFLFFL